MSTMILLLMILLYSDITKAAPDNFGRKFIIPGSGRVCVSTFKHYNVSVRSSCHRVLPDFNVSFGSPVILLPTYSSPTTIQADDDIVVFVGASDNVATPLFPIDVLTSTYLVMTGERVFQRDINELLMFDNVDGSTYNITFKPCAGNCTLPVCATRNYSATMPSQNCSHLAIYSCIADLTGAQITGNNPILIMTSDGSTSHQLPPTSTWGRQLIIPRSPANFRDTVKLKIMTKDPDTNVRIQCTTSPTNMRLGFKDPGSFVKVNLDSFNDCVLTSNHPILALYENSGEVKGMIFIYPTEQFTSDYIFSPPQLCGDTGRVKINKTVVVIIKTIQVTGLRINGLNIPPNAQQHQIANTNFTRIFVYMGNETLVTLRHIQSNVGFGASLVCTSHSSLTVPLGSRMAPIAEPCVANVGIPGDGLDNDCDGFIDEDICSSNANGRDCSATSKDYIPCLGYIDDYGVTWTTTYVNEYDYQPCGTDNSSNFCKPGEGFIGVWQGPDRSLCGNPDLLNITSRIKPSNNESLGDLLYQAWNLTDKLIRNRIFSANDIKTVVGGLDSAATILQSRPNVSTFERDNFVGLLDRTLSSDNDNTWKILNNKTDVNYASVIMTIVPRFGDAVLKNSSSGGTINKQNIILEGRKGSIDDVLFPKGIDLSYNNDTKAQLFLSKETIINSLSGSIDYTAIYYRTLAQFMPYINGSNIGSDIVSFSLRERHNTADLVPPVQILFKHSDESGMNSTCVFWSFNESGDGRWSDTGCYAVYWNSSFTACRCNHLTNFAVLLSSVAFSQDHEIALTLITWPGCVVSILALVITLVLYICLWRNLQSDKTKILVSLCTVLILAYTLLLAGLNQSNDKTACSAIAVVLHFLFLCAIFLMAAEGVEVAMTILTAFSQRKSHAVKLIVFSLVTPAVIVLISGLSTNLNGYGTDKYCWLDFSNGLIYAFLVPCSVVVLVNIILAALVVRKMFTTKAMMKKETKDKVIAGVRSIAVLSPVLGLTWLFGILAFHKDLIVFSYLFAIFNSFQGLLIFIFHGIMNVKIQQGVQRRWNRFKAEYNLVGGKKKDVSKTDTTELKSSTSGTSR